MKTEMKKYENEIIKIKEMNIRNLEENDEIIEKIQNENEEKTDTITQLKNELRLKNKKIKEIEDENEDVKRRMNGNEIVILEMGDDKKRMTKEQTKTANEIKTLKTTINTYKLQNENLSGELQEQKATVATLNDYTKTLSNINKELITRDNWGGREEEYFEQDESSKEKVNEERVEQNISMSKLYIGNLNQQCEEKDLIHLFNLQATQYLINTTKVEIKIRERKATKTICKYNETADGCRFKRNCRWIHLDELNESLKYAIITLPTEVGDELIKLNKIEFQHNKIIIEPISTSNKYTKDENRGENNANKTCRYFANGMCRKGNNCTFMHKKEIIKDCNFFKENKCRYGNKCKYNHNVLAENTNNFLYQGMEKSAENTNNFLQQGMEKRMLEIEQLIRQLMFRPSPFPTPFQMGSQHHVL